jgi:hypothetical protein
MVVLALLIAESDPSQKDLMIRLTLNLLADRERRATDLRANVCAATREHQVAGGT